MTERFLPDATTAEALLSQAEDQFAQVALELGEAARRAVEGEPGAAKLAAQAALLVRIGVLRFEMVAVTTHARSHLGRHGRALPGLSWRLMAAASA